MPNPFGFATAISPDRRPVYQNPTPEPVPFGFPAPKSKMAQTADILKPYLTGPVDAFWSLMNSPFALGFDPTEQDAANGLMAAGGPIAAGSVVPKPSNALMMGIKAYHGSPHSFDKFDMSKIGTGEGAQAYGHGLYFADSEGVAKSYRDGLSGNIINVDGKPYQGGLAAADAIDNLPSLTDAAKESIRWHVNRGYKFDEAIKDLKTRGLTKDAASVEAAIASGQLAGGTPGSMYEVNIDADPNAFLDWDKPLSEQPKNVQDALAKIDADMWHPSGGDYDPTEAGQSIYQRVISVTDKNRDKLKSKYGEEALFKHPAELANKELGIPGIKYLDAGSRGAGDGTRNYVVFDDKLVSIVKKYGIAGASAMLGYNILDGMDPAQAEELKRIEGNQ